MRVFLIGATGKTGGQALEILLEQGHTVTALCRDPGALAARHERLTVVKGDARDAESLERGAQGQEAVLVAFGPRSTKKDDLQEALMRNLVPALEKHGVRRVVNLSALGAGDSYRYSPLVWKIIMRTFLKSVFVDKDRGEAILLASQLDYVNVRPGQLLDSPARGGVKASLDGAGLGQKMTRADLARFMVEQLSSDTWVRKSPLIGY